MTSYTFCKCTLTSVILLAFATAVSAQVAPTPEEIQFVSVLGKRIRSKSQAEVATMQTQQLEPAITAEQQAERVRNDLVTQSFRIGGRIECLNRLLREYPRIRGNADPNITQQQINALRAELLQLNRQLAAVKAQLNPANTALNDARERRLAAERNVASKQGTNIQQFNDLRYLYDAARGNPPRFDWKALMERMTAVALEKQLTSNVTISTGAIPVTVKYQLVTGGQEFRAVNCRTCVVRVPVGKYNFWVETAGSADPQKTAKLIFDESQSIQISR
jgi:hypothetical protein